MDEEDGISMSNTADLPNNPIIPTDVKPLILPTTEFKSTEEVVVSLPKEKKRN